MLEMYLKQIEHNIFQVHQIKSAFLDNVKLVFFCVDVKHLSGSFSVPCWIVKWTVEDLHLPSRSR